VYGQGGTLESVLLGGKLSWITVPNSETQPAGDSNSDIERTCDKSIKATSRPFLVISTPGATFPIDKWLLEVLEGEPVTSFLS
jgi:hypothetical protein